MWPSVASPLIDLSLMVKESTERSSEGARVRQWDAAFPLAGKAKGGDLVVKLGFQIMEDGGVEIYKQTSKAGSGISSASTARRQSKSSFSVSSPKPSRPEPVMTPSRELMTGMDLRGIDDFNLDEPGPPPPPPPPPTSTPYDQELDAEQKQDDLDLPEFIDKGVELQQGERVEEEEAVESESAADEGSVSSEVVKEVVHDSPHLVRLTELDAIAQQIKALESMVAGDEAKTAEQGGGDQRLDADEETVTREFLQMLELEEDGKEELGLDVMHLTTDQVKAEAVRTGSIRGVDRTKIRQGLVSDLEEREDPMPWGASWRRQGSHTRMVRGGGGRRRIGEGTGSNEEDGRGTKPSIRARILRTEGKARSRIDKDER